MTDLKNVEDLIPKELEEQWDDIMDYEYPATTPEYVNSYFDIETDEPVYFEEPETSFDDEMWEDEGDMDYEYPFTTHHDFKKDVIFFFEELIREGDSRFEAMRSAERLYGRDSLVFKMNRDKWLYFDDAVDRIKVFMINQKLRNLINDLD